MNSQHMDMEWSVQQIERKTLFITMTLEFFLFSVTLTRDSIFMTVLKTHLGTLIFWNFHFIEELTNRQFSPQT